MKNNEWSSQRWYQFGSQKKEKSNWFKQSSHGPPCHLLHCSTYIMADITSVSDSENLDKAKEAKAQAESVKDDTESEEGGTSEFEIEQVLDAKRGYFPEVCTTNQHYKSSRMLTQHF